MHNDFKDSVEISRAEYEYMNKERFHVHEVMTMCTWRKEFF